MSTAAITPNMTAGLISFFIKKFLSSVGMRGHLPARASEREQQGSLTETVNAGGEGNGDRI
jgi:hypothetical protein